METPLNIKLIRKAQAIFVLVCILTLVVIASQVYISLDAAKSINYEVSTFSAENKTAAD